MALPKFLQPIGSKVPAHSDRVPLDVAQAEAPRFEKVIWYKEPHLRKLYFLIIFLLIASATTGYDGMMVNTSQQMDKWKEYFPEEKNESKLGILINMYNIGSIVSFFIVPYLADNWGRKPTIMLGCVIMIIGSFVSAFCNGYGMYMGGRFVLGFGNSLAQMSSPMLLTEICHPQHRGPLTAVYNCLWNLGSLIVSVVGWGTASINGHWSWRSITFIQAVPSIIQLCGIWWVPESPRFLINKDKSEEALQVLAKHHAGGDVNNTTVQFQYREIKETIQADKSVTSTRYIDFLRTSGNRWRLAIIISLGIISQYSGNALFSNYMDVIYEGAGIKEQNKKLALSAGKTILDLSISIGAAFTVDKVGRRPLFLTAISGMVFAFILWTLTGGIYENSQYKTPATEEQPDGGVAYSNTGAGYAQIAFVWLFGIFYDIGFSGLLVAYALEVLPFHLRAKGMMIMNITVQAILAIGNQTNKLAWNNMPNHWNFMLFYTLWDFCELIFVWYFYVETKGPTLEEIARIFDGDDAVAHIDLAQVEKETNLTRHESNTFEDYPPPKSLA
ncbi:major facilitator superfamily transporter [Fusarium phyllophilum]|uniref:Major facilitator superfamily transporter n=1 Tax=Fusarium phyllophilum TaxID=47803 RepID=A0A8H5NIV7_9HYPO|nr:major facilitator superfamily transporter [Fusarium phyllophilum]